MTELSDLERLQEHIRARIKSEGLRPLAAKLGLEVGVIRSAQDARNMKFSNLVRVLDALEWRLHFAPASTFSNRSAEGVMDEIEAKLQAPGATVPGAKDRGGPDHTRLVAIAMDGELDDQTRARADLILRLAFDDEAAEHRHAAREIRIREDRKRAETIVRDVTMRVGFTPTPNVTRDLVHLEMFYRVGETMIETFLYDLKQMKEELDDASS